MLVWDGDAVQAYCGLVGACMGRYNPKDAFAEAKRRIRQAFEEGARDLDLGGLGLTELPQSLGQLVWLRELRLDGN